jgi:hypothetical protein
MQSLSDPLECVKQRQKTLDVYTDSDETVRDIAQQFATRNVAVTQHPYDPGDGQEFIIIRDADGDTQGAVGVTQFQQFIAPNVTPLWNRPESATSNLFDFLDNTLFVSFDRKQMLSASREIEDRAWRVGAGTVYAGFQNSEAFRPQKGVYERLATDTALDIWIYMTDTTPVPDADTITVVSDERPEIGLYWFVVFDGGPNEQNKCGLLAREQENGTFYGFWTYEAAIVDDIIAYLQRTYGKTTHL